MVRYQEGQRPTLVQRYRFDSGAFTVYEVPYTGITPDPVAFGEMAYYFGQKNGETRLYALNLATGQAVDTGVWGHRGADPHRRRHRGQPGAVFLQRAGWRGDWHHRSPPWDRRIGNVYFHHLNS